MTPRCTGVDAEGNAQTEADHYMKCPERGDWFDMRDLAQLFWHAHDAEIEIEIGPVPRRLETGPQRQQNRTDCHKENARPVRFEPQESHAAPSRLQSAAYWPAGIRAAKRSPPNSSAHHVQDTAENEQRAEPDQEHSRLLNSSLPRTTEPGFKTVHSDSFRNSLQRLAVVVRPQD